MVTGRGPAAGTATPPATWRLDVLDDMRRSAGRMLDPLGHGPQTTPSAIVELAPGVWLHTYPDADPILTACAAGPSPMRRCDIFDLDPRCGVVARSLRRPR
jgi:polyhydroxyalkanoate synthase